MGSEDLAPLGNATSPHHITLLFKCARHTVLLSVSPSTAFTEITSSLLLALKSRNITSIADMSVPPPDRGDLVEFGTPKDKRNLKKGFVALVMAGQMSNDKIGTRKVNGAKPGPIENPTSAGLADGSILAFRFKSSNEAEGIESGGDETSDHSQIRWNVELPQYDDEDE